MNAATFVVGNLSGLLSINQSFKEDQGINLFFGF